MIYIRFLKRKQQKIWTKQQQQTLKKLCFADVHTSSLGLLILKYFALVNTTQYPS